MTEAAVSAGSLAASRRAVLAALVTIAAMGAVLLIARFDGPQVTFRDGGATVQVVAGSLRYDFSVSTGKESLFELDADPDCRRDLAPELPSRTRELRTIAERRLGLDSLDELREGRRDAVEALHRLGYL